jgi:hypothetical protein
MDYIESCNASHASNEVGETSVNPRGKTGLLQKIRSNYTGNLLEATNQPNIKSDNIREKTHIVDDVGTRTIRTKLGDVTELNMLLNAQDQNASAKQYDPMCE